MDNKEYVEAAHRTMSDGFHGELVSRVTFQNAVRDCIIAAQNLDKIKKALYYGRALPAPLDIQSAANCTELTMGFAEQIERSKDPESLDDLQHRIMHGIIGKATEAGELLEAMIASFEPNSRLDFVNVAEECGDGMWYDAILLEAIGTNISAVQATNIAKLKARFPGKFTEYAAENRNLEVERKILEG